jgi:hypothetical protein
VVTRSRRGQQAMEAGTAKTARSRPLQVVDRIKSLAFVSQNRVVSCDERLTKRPSSIAKNAPVRTRPSTWFPYIVAHWRGIGVVLENHELIRVRPFRIALTLYSRTGGMANIAPRTPPPKCTFLPKATANARTRLPTRIGAPVASCVGGPRPHPAGDALSAPGPVGEAGPHVPGQLRTSSSRVARWR